MIQPNNASGAKWLVILVVIIIGLAIIVGLTINDASWLNRNIGNATAEQIVLQTEVERRQAELQLQLLEQQTALEIQRQVQQAEYEAAQLEQDLIEQTVQAAQNSNFRADLLAATALGIKVLVVAIGGGLVIFSYYGGRKLYGQVNVWNSPQFRYSARKTAQANEKRNRSKSTRRETAPFLWPETEDQDPIPAEFPWLKDERKGT